MAGGFFEGVYEIVAKIPPGKVATYGQIAKMLGRPRGARAVGFAMRRCPGALPWQRVVMQGGAVAGGFCADERKSMLEGEGVSFLPDGRVDMRRHAWLP